MHIPAPTTDTVSFRGSASDLRWRVVLVCLIGLALLLVTGFVAGIPVTYADLVSRCVEAGCTTRTIPPDLHTLMADGLSGPVYAIWRVVLASSMVFGMVVMAAVVVWRKPLDRMAVWVSMVLLGYVLTRQSPLALFVATRLGGAWSEALDIVHGVSQFGIYIIAFTFPSLTFVPRWTRTFSLFIAGYVLLWRLPPTWAIVPTNWPPALLIGMETTLFLLALGAQIYRFRAVSTPVERQQARWVILGVALGGGASIAFTFWFMMAPPPLVQVGSFSMAMGHMLVAVVWMFVPVCVGVAVLRYRLWNIDPIINRALVYGILTAGVVAFYVVVVGVLGSMLRPEGDFVLSLVVTGVVAVLFQPVRERVQRAINRLLYGERDDPYAVISRLGQRLETTLAPNAVLPVIVQTVSETLKLPYVAIAVDHDGVCVAAASVGVPTGLPLVLPLVYRGETIGQLILGPRSPGDRWNASDRRLLDDLARQAGIAANAVRLHVSTTQLAADVQRSREQLVTAREEERRRLRRDLHDGLGPAIAAQTIKVGTARYLLGRDPMAAEGLLLELETDLVNVLGHVREVVYNLRPPALDELGLIEAIRAATASAGPTLALTVDAPAHLPPLSAAVEVAAYRIITEAFTNVVRHAHATTCRITLGITIDDDAHCLELRISDDGQGIPADQRSGVGQQAMRERAAELGGTCVIEPRPGGGTTVFARLPFAPPLP